VRQAGGSRPPTGFVVGAIHAWLAVGYAKQTLAGAGFIALMFLPMLCRTVTATQVEKSAAPNDQLLLALAGRKENRYPICGI
jgi:hypothetical protein